MSLNDLQAQLDQLQEAINQTSQLILKLSKTQPSDETPGESATDLAADIRDNLHATSESLELLKQDIDDVAPVRNPSYTTRRLDRPLTPREQERETTHKKLGATHTRITTDISNLRTRFRRANLSAKKNAERAQQAEQDAYLSDLRAAADAIALSNTNSADPTDAAPNGHADKHLTQSELRTSLFSTRRPQKHHQHQKTGDDLLLTTTSDLTLSLRRAHNTITSELSRSRFASETLASSNAALEELNRRYGGLDDLLSRSRGLLGTLLRSQKSDTWFLETAIYLLIGTIGWLVFRRLVYGPLWWFGYLPLRLAYNTIALIVGSGRRKALVGDIRPRFEPVQRAVTVGLDGAGGLDGSGTTPLMVQASAPAGLPSREARYGHSAKGGLNAERGSMIAGVEDILDTTALYASATDITTDMPAATAAPTTDDTQRSAGDEGISDNQARGGGADAGTEQGSGHDQDQQGGQQEFRRADGTVLRERDPEVEPRNLKKRMWEEPPLGDQREGGQQRQQRDEL